LSKNNELVSRGYNGSIFDLRYNFKKVFSECKFSYAANVCSTIGDADYNGSTGLGNNESNSVDYGKIHKIIYSINLMPSFGEFVLEDSKGNRWVENDDHRNGDALTTVCEGSDDIDMLVTTPMNELIAYKWNAYGFKWHFIGCIFHCFYIALLYLYIYFIYIRDPYSHGIYDAEEARLFHIKMTVLLNFGIVYSVVYEIGQLT
jgi:hypothetical protein